MSETPEKEKKPFDPRKFPPLKCSKNIKAIDELLSGDLSTEAVKHLVEERYSERYSRETFDRRREKLDRVSGKVREGRRLMQGTMKDRNLQTEIDKVGYELRTLGEVAEAVMLLAPDPLHPMFSSIKAFQAQVSSLLRRASELYNDFDHLGNLRYALNTMQLRIAKMFELELQMGMILKDNTTNLDTFVDMIERSVKIHQSLGLKPKFGDPQFNLQVNIGQMNNGQNTNVNMEPQSERYARLKAVADKMASMAPEEREKARAELLGSMFGKPQEATFQDVTDKKVDKPGV